jgi:hypothetical protein
VANNSDRVSYAARVDSWLDRAAVAAIETDLPDIAAEIVRTIQREVPGYSRPLRGSFGEGIQSGVEQALRRFTGERGAGQPDIYRRLGAGELRAGRSLDGLQSAYRVGARVAWQRMSQAAAGVGASAEAQQKLAGAMFAYIEEIAGESVEGYAQAQLARAGDTERRRSALLSLLLSSPPAPEPELAAAATEADWPLPAQLACLLVADAAAATTVRQLSGDSLHGPAGELTCIVVPEPSRVAHEAKAIAERHSIALALGPAVTPLEASRSLAWAQLAAGLREPRLTVAEERLPELALRGAPEIVAALRRRALAPLDGESERSRRILEQTLLAWLRHQGSQRAIASELGVHPQTVRYRLGRLRDLLGAALEEPEGRFELEIALRSRAGVLR